MSIITVAQSVWEGAEAWLMQRIVGLDAAPITQSSVTAVEFTVYRNGVEVASAALTIADVLFDALQTDAKWTQDSTGYNFLHILPRANLPDGNAVYVVQHKFTAVTTGYVSFGAEFRLTTRDVHGE